MKWLILFTITAMAFAVDIHSSGPIIPFTPVPDENPTIISFSNGVVFDTRSGEPTLPANLKIDSYDGAGYYLIQVDGPVYSEYIDQIKELGINVVGYIPKYALLSYATPEQMEMVNLKPFVRWTGIFQPAYKLQKEMMDAKGNARVTIQLFPDENTNSIASIIQSLGFDVVEVIDHKLCKTIDANVDLSRIDEVARISGVQWIQLWSEPTLANDNCQWVTQTGWRSSVPPDPGARRVWFAGIMGAGTVLSTTDSGIYTSHQQYYDAAYPITAPGLFPNHRKIVAYKLYYGAAFGDVSAVSWHGTHVNCTVAGNDTLLGTSTRDGMAKQAKIYFVDIANASGGLVVPTNLAPMYDTIFLGRGLGYTILQHSGSWGWSNSSGTYLTQDASTDAYIYAHPEFLNLYAAGNESSAMRVRNPGIAKDVLTIGATQNGTASNAIASFSSRGPTQDNRIKPNIMAPGQNIYSAQGGTTNGYYALSGTSMATPAANGSIGLIRHYLLAGFYPSGVANPADSIKYQSAALLRAMAMVSADPNVGSYTIPSYDIGWGRIDVDSVLFFTGDTRRLIIKDDTVGVGTGQSKVDSFTVTSSTIPMRIVVAWTDTAAAANANPTLVNDLNVTLTAPNGTYYRGNQYSGGQSATNPTTWDNRNVEECFRVNSPVTGIWTLTIAGQNVPNAPMGFAYAITGGIGPVGIEENTSQAMKKESFVCNTISNKILNIKVSLDAQKVVRVQVYDLAGKLVKQIINQRLPAGETEINQKLDLPNGVYFVELKTDNAKQYNKIILVQ